MSGETTAGEVPTRAGECENCARDDAELVAVHRVYVTPESWDTAGASEVVADVEWWCFSCRSMYPHRVDEPG
ncbi:MAG TPA: hypothetical protein VGI06_18950 [Acidimicrobiales bacterium]